MGRIMGEDENYLNECFNDYALISDFADNTERICCFCFCLGLFFFPDLCELDKFIGQLSPFKSKYQDDTDINYSLKIKK